MQAPVLLLIAFLGATQAFYIPGIAPVEFSKDDHVEVKAVKLTSVKTQLPYEYYSMPFCTPEKGFEYKAENLGEILKGDRIVNTPYVLKAGRDEKCRKLCEVPLQPEQATMLTDRIHNKYTVHLMADNLPVATKFKMLGTGETQYELGYRLGYELKDKAQLFVHNHLKFIVSYNLDEHQMYRIVGFEVEPSSIKASQVSFDRSSGVDRCVFKEEAGSRLEPQQVTNTLDKVVYTYEVVWRPSKVPWSSRWDIYLTMQDFQIHWFSIINSIVIIFFLAGVVTMIMVRTLRRDIAKYNRDDDLEETLEETGWKLVHGDVFRPPRRARLLIALLGSGVQLFMMFLSTICLAALGMLSPASRGSLMTAATFFYVFSGLVSGYFSARMYKTMKGVQWKSAALLTGLLLPAIVLGTGFFINFFVWAKASSGAVPFGTMVALLALWLCVSVPLVMAGSFFGFRKQPYEHPVRTNQIPRAVPDQKWYSNVLISILITGILPFGAVFIELFFILTAIWEKQFYYLFGFLLAVFIILIISCAQISVVMTYFQLCSEDYHWWWRSFIISGGCAFYVLVYSIFYFVTKLSLTDFVSVILYFGYSMLMVIVFWIFTGTVGFYASYWFVRRIYGAIKID
ncbi:hypothetical protein BOX15_Mlig011865g1 [Macrostomum lignano]|uniref:Uncharacterized protein n=2 Tax=Macrostomum lignano TaxID=282301 RepID=A0A267EMB2_9PLAT|nr:hypothetical protein BOX15_Mlig011865g2 [Macrostomum lignano]PAA62648.1 hypothetical protein BOX15_Mlig011865g1 [Macrostomum lignano]